MHSDACLPHKQGSRAQLSHAPAHNTYGNQSVLNPICAARLLTVQPNLLLLVADRRGLHLPGALCTHLPPAVHAQVPALQWRWHGHMSALQRLQSEAGTRACIQTQRADRGWQVSALCCVDWALMLTGAVRACNAAAGFVVHAVLV